MHTSLFANPESTAAIAAMGALLGPPPEKQYHDNSKACGRIESWYGTDGVKNYKHWICRDYHHCKYCLGLRADKYKQRVLDTLGDAGGLTFSIADTPAESTKINRLLGLDNYVRLPNSDGTATIYVKAELADKLYNYTLQEVNRAYLQDVDWRGAVSTPRGARITGRLGKKPEIMGSGCVDNREAEDDPEKLAELPRDLTLLMPYIYTTAPINDQNDSIIEAIKATSDTIPDYADDESITNAIERRARAEFAALKKRGATCEMIWRKETHRVVPYNGWLVWREGLQMSEYIYNPLVFFEQFAELTSTGVAEQVI